MNWNSSQIRRLIQLALEEDQARRDITTQTLIDPRWTVTAVIRAKQPGVLAGLPLAGKIFKALDHRCQFQELKKDGTVVSPGTVFARITCHARALLSGERPALNALQHLSGIATYTAHQVRRLRGSRTRLLDTRKTLPGWRVLEKYAVRCGGGQNHRMTLSDAVLVKDNHLKMVRLAGTDWVKSMHRFTIHHPRIPVQVEIQNTQDLQEALELKPSSVLLDNWPVPTLRKMIRRLRKGIPGVQIEISGGVKPGALSKLGHLGVERISMGRLTHSAPAFDCSLDITHVHTR